MIADLIIVWTDLERLSKAELVDLVLRLQQPSKTYSTSSRPPSTDRKAQQDKSRPGGAKPGHPGHSRRLSEDFDQAVDRYPDQCSRCGVCLSAALPAAAKGTPFGPRLHAVATYLKTFQALSYKRLEGAFADLFGVQISPGRPDEHAPLRRIGGPSRRADPRHSTPLILEAQAQVLWLFASGTEALPIVHVTPPAAWIVQ